MIKQTAHRAYPVPTSPWIQFQRWDDLLFAHWQIPADQLRAAIPAGLTLDTFEGDAWLGVVPFEITGIRWRGFPPLPGLAGFPELNVRTYVTVGDKPGVYFFSLDAANLWAVVGARVAFHLPYFHARMTIQRDGEWVNYQTRRIRNGAIPAEFTARYRPTGDGALAQPGTLTHWLTERYCLYAVNSRGTIFRAEIHHAPWLLQPAELEITSNTMAQVSGFNIVDAPNAEPLLHFSKRQEVVVWFPTKVSAAKS